ncbi:MAG: NADH-quinone oxidoreductase subunit B family protein [Thermoanaerobaculia bacterium]
MTHAVERPKIAVFKFASCDGCQLAMLCLEDELVTLASKVDIAYFLEARSRKIDGPYDVAFVEGSITTAEDLERIQEIRADSKYLVTIGACAMAGGIQALRNWQDVDAFTRAVYATPAYIHTLKESTPIAMHVPVDYELAGCPVNKLQLLELITSLLMGRVPQIQAHAVCLDCKRIGNVCVMVAQGIACMGPITHAGCGALCPSFNRGCYGCFGPSETSKSDVMADYLVGKGMTRPEVIRLMRQYTGYAQPFRQSTEKLEKMS